MKKKHLWPRSVQKLFQYEWKNPSSVIAGCCPVPYEYGRYASESSAYSWCWCTSLSLFAGRGCVCSCAGKFVWYVIHNEWKMIVADKWHAPVLACPLHYYTTTDTLPHFAFSVFTLRIYLLYCLFPIIMHVARFQTFASITSAYRKMEHISLLSLRLQARSVLYGLRSTVYVHERIFLEMISTTISSIQVI